MKKVFLTVFVSGAFLSVVQAQTRDCGTMQYLELRKQKDPSLEKRMDENEKLIAKWIQEHPATEVTSKAVLSSIPGFKATGNVEQDRINYANAKSKYVAEHGLTNGKKNPASIVDKSLREKKRKSNAFIY